MEDTEGLAARAYHQMRDAILKGQFDPGEPLFESRLAGHLGMSRTPVREALKDLVREGFLNIVPTRGYFIQRHSPQDVRELFELREGLEGLASRYAALRASDGQIEELGHLCHLFERAAGVDDWTRAGSHFHDKILFASGNSRLSKLLESLKSQIVMTRHATMLKVPNRHIESAQEHRALFEALRTRDPDTAEQQARLHVRRSYEATLRNVHDG